MGAVAAAGKRMLGVRNDPYPGYGFFVEFEGLMVGAFTEVSGFQIETATERYREGGLNAYEHVLAGPTRCPCNLVLKRGVTDFELMWLWYAEVMQGTIKRRNGTIYLLDRASLPAVWWDITGAYPVKWTGPDLRADSNAVAFETLELAHRGFSKPMESSMMSAARLAAGAVTDVAGR